MAIANIENNTLRRIALVSFVCVIPLIVIPAFIYVGIKEAWSNTAYAFASLPADICDVWHSPGYGRR